MNEFIYNSFIKQKTEKFKSEERTKIAKKEVKEGWVFFVKKQREITT